MDKETCDYTLIQEKTVVEEVEDKVEQISLADAKMIDPSYEIGDIVQIPVESKSFGRIATQNAKNLILQKIREEERKVVYDQYFEKKRYRDRCGSEIYWQECQCKPWKSRCDPY